MPKPNHFDYGFLIYKNQEVAKKRGREVTDSRNEKLPLLIGFLYK